MRQNAAGPEPSDDVSPGMTIVLSLWFGALTGLVEAAYLAVKGIRSGHWMTLGPDAVWQAPLGDLMLFGAVGLVLAGWWWWRGRRSAAAVLVLASMAGSALALLHARLYPFAGVLLGVGIGVQTSRLVARWPAGFLRLARRSVAWLLAATVALTAGLRGNAWLDERRAMAGLPPAPADAPNVLLLVIDTGRRSNFSVMGYSRPTTPALARWAERGVLFDHAFATSPWTLPSHSSMFTGRFPHELSAGWRTPLDATYPTIAEVLRDRGYATGGFVANLQYCTRENGLQRGFIHYRDVPWSLGEFFLSTSLGRRLDQSVTVRRAFGYYDMLGRKKARDVNTELLGWLSSLQGRPFFAFVNYYDVHEPYDPPKEYATRFGPDDARPLALLRHFPHRAFIPNRSALSPTQLKSEADAYDAALAYVDHEIDSLLTELDRRGILNRTFVTVTSDHGEQFGEHGLYDHGNSLYGQGIDVPLVMLYPGAPAGGVVRGPASLRDLPATVAELVGSDQHPFPGTSLIRFAADSTLAPEPVIAQLTLPGGRKTIHTVIAGGLKAIWGPDSVELYDLEADPAELHSLAGTPEGRVRMGRLSAVYDSLIRGSARVGQ